MSKKIPNARRKQGCCIACKHWTWDKPHSVKRKKPNIEDMGSCTKLRNHCDTYDNPQLIEIEHNTYGHCCDPIVDGIKTNVHFGCNQYERKE